ncbi:Alpha-tocopherol transfer protein-like [Tribolium castaneum]|uniref:Alpha-tocopherol transfer protein-like n=1 Tax=Tribolium castaneum TaxID=7070 RepID=D2A504_TRICA|nr:Alpha-tocopherol transfer protein-like [Tribolium castaneum]
MALNFFDPKTELTKDKNLREDDIKTLIDWVNKQAHLPKINEVQAILFLQSCNYRNEAAKSAIDSYFTVKTFCADLFGGRNPLQSPLRESLNVALFAFLPKKTPQGDTIIFMKLMDSNPDNYNFSVQLKHFDMVCMLGLHQEGVSNGHIIVLDMKEVVFGHLTKLGPLAMKKFLYYLQEAMPLRLKGLHYFNIVPFMDKILALMRPFMKKELLDMLYLHNTVDDLVKFVPRECLPLDYGGSVESTHVIHEKTKNKLRENCAFFDWEDKQVVDETTTLAASMYLQNNLNQHQKIPTCFWIVIYRRAPTRVTPPPVMPVQPPVVTTQSGIDERNTETSTVAEETTIEETTEATTEAPTE